MIFRNMSFFFSEALIGMRRAGLMTLISMVTITVSLIMFGVFLIVTVNLNHLADYVSSKLEIRVFLHDTMTRKEIARFQQDLLAMNAVKSVSFIDKKDAWKQFHENHQNMPLDSVVHINPLPHAFRVVLVDNQSIKMLSQRLMRMQTYVSDVVYGGAMAERLHSISQLIRLAGLVLVVFLTLSTLFIIVNTIRLTVINRQEEITIMKLVGATNPFISGPFIIEGLILGAGGALFSVCILKSLYLFFSHKIQNVLPYLPLVYDDLILRNIYLFVLLIGSLLGLIGAYISISKSLKVSI